MNSEEFINRNYGQTLFNLRNFKGDDISVDPMKFEKEKLSQGKDKFIKEKKRLRTNIIYPIKMKMNVNGIKRNRVIKKKD